MKKLFLILLAVMASHHILLAQIITTIAGNGNASNAGDGGQATAASIKYPAEGVFDRFGNYFFSTSLAGHTIRKINPAGIITTVAGVPNTAGFSGDGGPATAALLHSPQGVAVDTFGNIYIGDAYNNRVRRVNVSTGIITTIAGTGNTTYNGDNIPATDADIYSPDGLGYDKFGNLYIAEYGNNRIRKVTPSGTITTFAGTGTSGYNGDGGLADTSETRGVLELCVDDTGNVYLADEANGRVRKVDTFGIIHTIAGTGVAGYSGDGGQALSAEVEPHNITWDKKTSNIYFSDVYANKVRVIYPTGIIDLEAGTGVSGFSGDGGLADTAEFKVPHGVTTDTCGNLYICDLNNVRIRKVTFDSTCGKADTTHTDTTNAVQSIKSGGFSVYPNPASKDLTIETSPGLSEGEVTLYNMLGEVVYNKAFNSNKTTIDISSLPNGVYFVKVNSASGGMRVEKVLKE